MIEIQGIDHVQLAIPKNGEEVARDFYGALLRLREIAKPSPLAARGGCWFEGSGVVLHLGVEETFHPAQKAHPAFLVKDLEVVRRSLLAAHVPVLPDTILPTVKRFYAFDPFGNRLEFIQAGDGFSQRR